MPDPASGMEFDPEFERLVEEFSRAHVVRDLSGDAGRRLTAARELLHRWHLDAVERAVREAANVVDRLLQSARAEGGMGNQVEAFETARNLILATIIQSRSLEGAPDVTA